jgi:hypothetical protein
MPKDLPLPSAVVSNKRHCTRIEIPIPIGALSECRAEFSRRVEYEDGRVEIVADGSVTLTPQEFGALPAFGAAYAQLSAAVHSKREAYDA